MDSVYEPVPAKRPDTSYHPVNNNDLSPPLSEKETPYPANHRPYRRSRIFLHWLWHFLSLLWIGPIVVLLYLNFSKHVIGASAWCPRGNCDAQATTGNAIQRAYELDRQDHDVNGALQFVAKALEVWFVFIATSLIYDIAMLFAKKGRGLPVGYLLSHLEFADIRYIFNRILWTSPMPHRNSNPEKRARIIKLYLFAIFTTLLTILANLMGPATAVLVLPTLQWVQTPHMMNQTFNDTAVMYQPSGDHLFSGCSNVQLLARNYSCTQEVYGPSLDDWAAQSISTSRQAKTLNGNLIGGSSQEAALTFLLNATTQDLVWIPNRQVLRSMSHEYLKTAGLLTDIDEPEYPDKIYNNSLQSFLQRQGPSLGVQSGCYAGNVTDFTLDNNRYVRCYTGWTSPSDYTTNYTKCLRLGVGSDDNPYNSQFYLENTAKSSPDTETGVGVYFADKAMYFNKTTDFNSGLKSCFNNPTSAKCDWNRVFRTELLPEDLRNTSINVGVVSYQIPGEKNTDARVYCDHVTYQSFPTYSVDTSHITNRQALVLMDNLGEISKDAVPLVVNPDWFLAAWSVDVDTALDGNRQIVKELIRVLPIFYDALNGNYDETLLYDAVEFSILHLYALGQSLSMVNYYATDPPNHPTAEQLNDKDHHPIFHTYATLHVWAYGLSGRTSKLGVTVVVLGIACVIARLVMGVSTGVQERSTVEVLASMFEHRHQGEFEGLEGEGCLAKVRYRIVEDGEGRQNFLPEKKGRWSHIMHS